MSYDLTLVDPVTKEALHLDTPHLIAGGTYALGGTTECWINVTYNYAPIIYKHIPEGIRGFADKTGAETIPLLKDAISKLGDDVDDDYWKCTEGNVKKALCGILAIAQLRPDGIWEVF